MKTDRLEVMMDERQQRWLMDMLFMGTGARICYLLMTHASVWRFAFEAFAVAAIIIPIAVLLDHRERLRE